MIMKNNSRSIKELKEFQSFFLGMLIALFLTWIIYTVTNLIFDDSTTFLLSFISFFILLYLILRYVIKIKKFYYVQKLFPF